ncbi:MAG: hypothetical protein DRQ40_06295 [Gammaproteobacteria bacterium]|nr:MAG: hypothetical protein DRQ40_06295 [Gammaproteobacteria bacterium]
MSTPKLIQQARKRISLQFGHDLNLLKMKDRVNQKNDVATTLISMYQATFIAECEELYKFESLSEEDKLWARLKGNVPDNKESAYILIAFQLLTGIDL